MNPTNQTLAYNNGAKYLNVLGILSIVFGSLGLVAGLLFMIPALIPSDYYTNTSTFTAVAVFIFWIIPHAFFLISGIKLVKLPSPSEAKGLAITSIVLGAIWNFIILAFAIVALTQLKGYEEGYGASLENEPPRL